MADLKVTVRGAEYPVEVGVDGLFYTQDARGHRVSADTLAKVKDKLTRATARVSVQYTHYRVSWNGPARIVDGEFTGIHADERRLLAREDGKAEQFSGGHDTSGVLERLTDDERAELLALHDASRQAKEALESFLSQHKMHDPRARVVSAAKGDGDAESAQA